MRNYSYEGRWQKLLTPQIVNYLTAIHEDKGKQELIAMRHEDELGNLVYLARLQSTGSSNRLEGITVPDERLKKLVLNKTNPNSAAEYEIAGYREVLNMIQENYEHLLIQPSVLQQLHGTLYMYEKTRFGGDWKTTDNVIEEVKEDGTRNIRFRPVSARETRKSVEMLCEAYRAAIAREEADPLLLIPMFILDFLCIHPFQNGNGRMSRLLTLLLLYQNGFLIGRYISLENLIETTKDAYYDALQASSAGWHEENNDYEPFVRYMLGILKAAYHEFIDQTALLEKQRIVSKP